MYSFESGESIKKPLPPKGKTPEKKPAPRQENDGYTFTHHVDTFGDDLAPKEEEEKNC